MTRIRFTTGESSTSNEKEESVKILSSTSNEEMKETSQPSIPMKESVLVQRLRRAMNTIIKAPVKSNIIFQNTESAANHNAEVLGKVNFDWDVFKKQEENTSIHPENEFRELKYIEPLFNLHKNGDKLKEIVLNGASYHFDPSIDHSTEQAEEDLYFNID